MPRYFLEVSYKGTNYSGFQIQKNANSIQSEVEKALKIYFKKSFQLTGASRTDAGVHALQNYFHFDSEEDLPGNKNYIYSLNSILPFDIVVKKIFLVDSNAHCRFDAVQREYEYFIYQSKNPFHQDRAFYYPYKLDMDTLQDLALEILRHIDFTSFSKRNTQVKNFECTIDKSYWEMKNDLIIYHISGNRFLRGMVRGLVGTMLKAAKTSEPINFFNKIFLNRNCNYADFSVVPQGLFLKSVYY